MAVLTKPTSKKMISDAQRNLIIKLIEQRDWLKVRESVQATIITVKSTDADKQPQISMFSASVAIDEMLKLPVIAKVEAQKVKAEEKTKNTFSELQDFLKTLPASKYAFKGKNGDWVFVEIREAKKGSKTRFVNRLIGAPGDWKRKFLSIEDSMKVAQYVNKLGPKQCAIDYAEQHGRCAACDAHLSKKESIEASMGPICIKKFK